MSTLLLNMLNMIDFLSSPNTIRCNGQDKIRSWLATLLSSCICVFVITFFIYFSLELIERKNPKSYMISKYIPITPDISIDTSDDSLFFFIRINQHLTMKSLNSSYVNIFAELLYDNNNSLIAIYHFKPCAYEEDFNKANNNLFPMENKKELVNEEVTYFCINSLEKDNKTVLRNSTEYEAPTLINGKNSMQHTHTVLRLRVSRCSGYDYCVPEEEFNNMYPLNYQFFFIDHYVDIENYTTPIIPYLNQLSDVIFPGTGRVVQLEYNYISLLTKEGLILEDPYCKQNFKLHDSLSQSIDAETTYPNILTFVFMTVNSAEFYTRTYSRLQDVAANIGGIINMFMVIGQFINILHSKFYNNVVYYNEIFHNKIILKIEDTKKDSVLNVLEYDINSSSKKEINIANNAITYKRNLNSINLKNFSIKEELDKDKKISEKQMPKISYNCLVYLYHKMCKRKRHLIEAQILKRTNLLKDKIFDLKTIFFMYLDIFYLKKVVLDDENRKLINSYKIEESEILKEINEHFYKHVNVEDASQEFVLKCIPIKEN